MAKQKIVDVKIVSTGINTVSASWQLEDLTWTTAANFAVDSTVLDSKANLKKWARQYKKDYNDGVDIENATPTVPAEITSALGTALNL